MSVPAPAAEVRGSNWGVEPCPASHYWFAFWTSRGWTATCTRCGTSEHPRPAEHEQGHR